MEFYDGRVLLLKKGEAVDITWWDGLQEWWYICMEEEVR